MLMTLADRLLGMHGRMRNENRSQATVQMDVHFFVPVRIGDVVTGRARIVQDTRSLFFIEGDLFVGDTRVFSARGFWKKLGEYLRTFAPSSLSPIMLLRKPSRHYRLLSFILS